MQNVISLLQQNKGPSPQMSQAQPNFSGYGQNPPPPPPSQNVAQPINSLLSSLQSNQNNYNGNQQQPGQNPSSALMDMLARLGK
ncbi:CIC11C00000004496 [Sungouiella intermedia]|nr:CIC11C00000004496 [[Candida] intermedia]